MVPVGEKAEPFAVAVEGVTAPESGGERTSGWVGSEVVEAKRLESEALLRRYDRRDTEASGDLAGRTLGTLLLSVESESESCGSSTVGVGGIEREGEGEGSSKARGGWCTAHRRAGDVGLHGEVLWMIIVLCGDTRSRLFAAVSRLRRR